MTAKHHLDSVAILLLLVLCASWGFQQIAVKLVVQDVSPVMQAAIRSSGATVLVGLWMWIRKKPLFEKDGTLWWGLLAGLLFAVEFWLLYWGLEFTNASRAVIFLYLSPFVVAIGTQIFIPSERLGLIQYLGLICAFSGIAIAFGESLTLPSKEMLIGDSMIVVAAIMWGATTVVIKAGPLVRISSTKTVMYQLSFSAVFLMLCSFFMGEAGVVALSDLAIASLLFQTIWVATISFLIWFWMIRTYPAPKLTSFTFMTPIFGVLAGVLILDEPLTNSLLIAMLFVVTGVYLVNHKGRKAKLS